MQFRELTDRYQLQKIIKSTRFGTVLRAIDNQSGSTVVVKLITAGTSPGLAAGAAEFSKLANALAALEHPNLPAVLDFGFTTDGSAFLVLEPLAGKGLDTISGMPPGNVVSLAGQALAGLEAMAERGLAHHNVSPDNLLVDGAQVKLLGLGTAVFRPGGAAGADLGIENARFRAPELAAGGAADWRADLFSLALTACHALGATVGFGEPPVVQLPLAVSFELENDEALRQGLERALRQRPGERPTPRELRQALRLAAGAAWAPAAPAPRPRPVAPPASTPATVLPFQPLARPAPPQIQPAIPDARTPVMAPAPAAVLSAAAPAPSAAPELALPDPVPAPPAEEPKEVLSSVDDEVLNALLSVPPPPPWTPGGGEQGAGNAVPLQRPPTAGSADQAPLRAAGKAPLLRRPAVLAMGAGVLLLAAVATFWRLRPEPPQAVAAPPPPVVLAKLPSRPPLVALAAARLHLAQGEDLQARRILRAVAFGEQGLLSPAGCRELGAIEETLARAAWERLPADLTSGLAAGDLELLQAAVEAGAGREAALSPEVRANLDRAREAVDSYARARTAASQDDPVQVLEGFSALLTALPKASDPEGLRGRAAQALEAQAEALVKEARYAEALARLGPVQRTWPDREGLEERITRYDTYQQNEQQQAELLATLPGVERRKKPWDALQMLSEVEPTPHLAPRFAAARARLENLLAQLDQAPPQVVLRDGYLLEYARGTVAELSFRATDDYEVKDVKMMARRERGKFQEMSLEKSRSGYYTVEIPPDFHHNGLVELYLVATDLSGHEAYLGSPDQPLQLKRKQGFEHLIR